MMDNTLLGNALEYHGPMLVRHLKDNDHMPTELVLGHLRNFNAKALQSRDHELSEHIQKFVARRANLLFQPVEESEREELREDEDCYAKLPPLETFMGVSPEISRHHFYNSLEKRDLVIGIVSTVLESGLVLTLLCLDNGRARDIDELRITAFCPMKELPRLFPHLEGFQVKDFVRGVVLSVNIETERIIVSLLPRSLPEDIPHPKLGLITDEDFPVHYRRKLQGGHLPFRDLLHSIWGFQNVGNVKALLSVLKQEENISLMPGLNNLEVPENDYLENLRKYQNQKLAHRKVAEGIALFKSGKHLEALQLLNKSLQIDNQNVEAMVARGALYANNESFSQAVKDFKEALKINSQHQNARSYLYETLLAQGKRYEDNRDFDAAEEIYKDALTIRPEAEAAKEALIKLSVNKNRPKFTDERYKADREKKSQARLPDNPNADWSAGMPQFSSLDKAKRKNSKENLEFSQYDEDEGRRENRKQKHHSLDSNASDRRRRQSSTERMAETLKHLIAEDEKNPERLKRKHNSDDDSGKKYKYYNSDDNSKKPQEIRIISLSGNQNAKSPLGSYRSLLSEDGKMRDPGHHLNKDGDSERGEFKEYRSITIASSKTHGQVDAHSNLRQLTNLGIHSAQRESDFQRSITMKTEEGFAQSTSKASFQQKQPSVTSFLPRTVTEKLRHTQSAPSKTSGRSSSRESSDSESTGSTSSSDSGSNSRSSPRRHSLPGSRTHKPQDDQRTRHSSSRDSRFSGRSEWSRKRNNSRSSRSRSRDRHRYRHSRERSRDGGRRSRERYSRARDDRRRSRERDRRSRSRSRGLKGRDASNEARQRDRHSSENRDKEKLQKVRTDYQKSLNFTAKDKKTNKTNDDLATNVLNLLSSDAMKEKMKGMGLSLEDILPSKWDSPSSSQGVIKNRKSRWSSAKPSPPKSAEETVGDKEDKTETLGDKEDKTEAENPKDSPTPEAEQMPFWLFDKNPEETDQKEDKTVEEQDTEKEDDPPPENKELERHYKIPEKFQFKRQRNFDTGIEYDFFKSKKSKPKVTQQKSDENDNPPKKKRRSSGSTETTGFFGLLPAADKSEEKMAAVGRDEVEKKPKSLLVDYGTPEESDDDHAKENNTTPKSESKNRDSRSSDRERGHIYGNINSTEREQHRRKSKSKRRNNTKIVSLDYNSDSSEGSYHSDSSFYSPHSSPYSSTSDRSNSRKPQSSPNVAARTAYKKTPKASSVTLSGLESFLSDLKAKKKQQWIQEGKLKSEDK